MLKKADMPDKTAILESRFFFIRIKRAKTQRIQAPMWCLDNMHQQLS